MPWSIDRWSAQSYFDRGNSSLLNMNQEKERQVWLLLGEKSMAKIWDNLKDEETWKKYL